jgi:hypothetical protein
MTDCYQTVIDSQPVCIQGAANPSPEAADAIATVVRAARSLMDRCSLDHCPPESEADRCPDCPSGPADA